MILGVMVILCCVGPLNRASDGYSREGNVSLTISKHHLVKDYSGTSCKKPVAEKTSFINSELQIHE